MSMADVALCPAVPILLFGDLDVWDEDGRKTIGNYRKMVLEWDY